MANNSNGDLPAPRGRLGAQLNARLASGPFPGVRQRGACTVNATLGEDGTFILALVGRVEYRDGAHVGATIEQDDIPAQLARAVKTALQAVLDEGHQALIDEADREADLAYRHGGGNS